MNKDGILKTFIPQYEGRTLDFIKICAVVFMGIDHINAICYKNSSFYMMLIGRGAFPLFCYAMALAVIKAKASNHSRKKEFYITRLLLLAVLSQPFFYFALDKITGNVVFTLAAGAAVAFFIEKIKLWQVYALYLLTAFSTFLPQAVDFGLPGIVLPSAMLLAIQGKKSVYPFLLLLLFSLNGHDAREFPMFSFFMGFSAIILPFMVIDFASNIPPGRRWLPKYALHVFYPAHLALIKTAALVFFK